MANNGSLSQTASYQASGEEKEDFKSPSGKAQFLLLLNTKVIKFHILHKKYLRDFETASILTILEIITHKNPYICIFFTLSSNIYSNEGVQFCATLQLLITVHTYILLYSASREYGLSEALRLSLQGLYTTIHSVRITTEINKKSQVNS